MKCARSETCSSFVRIEQSAVTCRPKELQNAHEATCKSRDKDSTSWNDARLDDGSSWDECKFPVSVLL